MSHRPLKRILTALAGVAVGTIFIILFLWSAGRPQEGMQFPRKPTEVRATRRSPEDGGARGGHADRVRAGDSNHNDVTIAITGTLTKLPVSGASVDCIQMTTGRVYRTRADGEGVVHIQCDGEALLRIEAQGYITQIRGIGANAAHDTIGLVESGMVKLVVRDDAGAPRSGIQARLVLTGIPESSFADGRCIAAARLVSHYLEHGGNAGAQLDDLKSAWGGVMEVESEAGRSNFAATSLGLLRFASSDFPGKVESDTGGIVMWRDIPAPTDCQVQVFTDQEVDLHPAPVRVRPVDGGFHILPALPPGCSATFRVEHNKTAEVRAVLYEQCCVRGILPPAARTVKKRPIIHLQHGEIEAVHPSPHIGSMPGYSLRRAPMRTPLDRLSFEEYVPE